MAGRLRKLRLASMPAISENDDEENFNTDYSIAMEYHGPVGYAIPQVIPVNISQIPIQFLIVFSLNMPCTDYRFQNH
jgi:hypothetical protein